MLPTATLIGSAATPAITSAAAARCFTPEQFGAIGDGIADDAKAIQRALDAAAATPSGATVLLQPRHRYRCATGLVLDTTTTCLWGNATLDFSGWVGPCIRVTASTVAAPRTPDNNFGAKGLISGSIRILGSGPASTSVGLLFDSPVRGTSAQLLSENMAISNCGIGIKFQSRAYNSTFVRCEIFNCTTCIDWVKADDNGERNTFLGCILYNSDLAVRISLDSAQVHLVSCSIDYTKSLYEVQAGRVFATSCHHESNRWIDAPIKCIGADSLVRLDGGMILNQAAAWQARNLVDVARGATVQLDGISLNNLTLLPPDASRPAALARGSGEFTVTQTHSDNFSALPARVHDGVTSLSDPDFTAPVWQDPLWRIADTAMPITDRYRQDGANLRLEKGMLDGESGLIAAKTFGSTSQAAFFLCVMPVRHGDTISAGFRLRRDPRRPGTDGTIFVSPCWLRIDGQSATGIPNVVRRDHMGTLTVAPPADQAACIAPLASREARTAPRWATHFAFMVDLVKAHEATFFVNGLWADIF